MRRPAHTVAVAVLAVASVAAGPCRTVISVPDGPTIDVPDWRVVQVCTYRDGQVEHAVSLDPESGWLIALIKGAVAFGGTLFGTGGNAPVAAGAGGVAVLDSIAAPKKERPVCWENYRPPGAPVKTTPPAPAPLLRKPAPSPQREALELPRVAPGLKPDDRRWREPPPTLLERWGYLRRP
jgi:hypothetical protein